MPDFKVCSAQPHKAPECLGPSIHCQECRADLTLGLTQSWLT